MKALEEALFWTLKQFITEKFATINPCQIRKAQRLCDRAGVIDGTRGWLLFVPFAALGNCAAAIGGQKFLQIFDALLDTDARIRIGNHEAFR